MSDEILSRVRYGEAFWRAHHEAWRRSELNQREYCEAEGIPLKAFGNWRAKFKAEPQPLPRRLLYRRARRSRRSSCRRHATAIGGASARRTSVASLRRRGNRARAFPRWRVAMG